MRYFSISLLLMAFLCVLPACSDMGSDGDKNKADMAKTGQNASDSSYFDDQMQKQNETKRKDMTIPEDAPLVVMFGDSLYAGYQLDNDAGLVPQLQAALYDKDMPVKMHNAAVSGDTTNGGLQRIKFVLDGLDRKPDLFVLGLGGNDMLRAVPAAQTRKNLDEMMQILQERGIKVLITGMVAPPIWGRNMNMNLTVSTLIWPKNMMLCSIILSWIMLSPIPITCWVMAYTPMPKACI